MKGRSFVNQTASSSKGIIIWLISQMYYIDCMVVDDNNYNYNNDDRCNKAQDDSSIFKSLQHLMMV